MGNIPKISVILPVYNAEKYIAESIDSILQQTFKDFEFIIINDGSKDRSEEIIRSYKDERIVYLAQQNMGLAATLNRGITLARGEYIARQDNDDISLPQRFSEQVKFLDTHPEVALLGTWAQIMDETGRPTARFHRHETSSERLKFSLLFDNPFVHSSVMFRKELIKQIGAYDVSPEVFEDYNLWSRVARVASVANLPLPLLKYREVATGMSKTASDYQVKVRKQSVDNIKYYSPSLKEEETEGFFNVDGLLHRHGFKRSLQYFERILLQLKADFCKRENVSEDKIDPALLDLRLNFRRKLYNTIINSGSFSWWAKLKAKLGRKIMFIRYKEQLS